MSAAVLAVSGCKNSGKTTLIESLVPLLTQAGLRIAVIKHDGHSFSPDVPNTDTWRFLQAGAVGTVVFDSEKFMAVRRTSVDARFLIELFPEADLVLLEGFKESDWPKLRIDNGQVSCSFCSRSFCRNDTEAIAALILSELTDRGYFTQFRTNASEDF